MSASGRWEIGGHLNNKRDRRDICRCGFRRQHRGQEAVGALLEQSS